eukprot:5889286-Pleurochrysis_carterae.AAC.3
MKEAEPAIFIHPHMEQWASYRCPARRCPLAIAADEYTYAGRAQTNRCIENSACQHPALHHLLRGKSVGACWVVRTV